MKKKMERQQKEVLYKIWGNAVWGGGLKIPLNISGIHDWILTQKFRNTLSLQ